MKEPTPDDYSVETLKDVYGDANTGMNRVFLRERVMIPIAKKVGLAILWASVEYGKTIYPFRPLPHNDSER